MVPYTSLEKLITIVRMTDCITESILMRSNAVRKRRFLMFRISKDESYHCGKIDKYNSLQQGV